MQSQASHPLGNEYWRRLLHRWLVEYNPVYLVSAALVLYGLNLVSKGMAVRGDMYNELGVAAIAEVYAAGLILGAAFLVRRGSPRPAVMLGLLAILYQGDLTLQTETNVYLGAPGVVASSVWVGIFAAKLAGLAWALRVQLSGSTWRLLMCGALGVAVLPRLSGVFPERGLSALVAVWWFSLVLMGLHSRREILSRTVLDAWGRTVLRRVVRASWLMLSLLLFGHVLFWCARFNATAEPLLPAAALLACRWMKRESTLWLTILVTLVGTAWALPSSLSAASLLVAITLAVRAFKRPTSTEPNQAPERLGKPYRTAKSETPAKCPLPRTVFIAAPRAHQLRYLMASLGSLHLALWCAHYTGGSWPEHLWFLNASLLAVALVCAWRFRSRAVLAVPGFVYVHQVAGLMPPPKSTVEWGATCVFLGFGLLLGGLGAHQKLRAWLEPKPRYGQPFSPRT